jgi:hypothetical protein
MTGGAHVAVRGGEVSWVGLVLGRSGPAGFPGAAQVGSWLLSFIFFLLLSVSFVSEICFEFLKGC